MSKARICPQSGESAAGKETHKAPNSCRHVKCICGRSIPITDGHIVYRHRVAKNG